jgi:hypothetical protein
LYYFAVRYLAEKRFLSVSLGLSRAFLNDGVLRYKRKWGQKLVATAPDRIALKIVADTPASRSLLENNPFIFEESGELCGAVFLADGGRVTAESAKRLKRQYAHDGLSKLILFRPHSGDSPPGLDLPTDVLIRPWPSPSTTSRA